MPRKATDLIMITEKTMTPDRAPETSVGHPGGSFQEPAVSWQQGY